MFTIMRNVTQLKGNKLAAVLGTAEIYQPFYLEAKMSQYTVFNLVFNEDSKMGTIVVPFVS
jgi:hypothetical protein